MILLMYNNYLYYKYYKIFSFDFKCQYTLRQLFYYIIYGIKQYSVHIEDSKTAKHLHKKVL